MRVEEYAMMDDEMLALAACAKLNCLEKADKLGMDCTSILQDIQNIEAVRVKRGISFQTILT